MASDKIQIGNKFEGENLNGMTIDSSSVDTSKFTTTIDSSIVSPTPQNKKSVKKYISRKSVGNLLKEQKVFKNSLEILVDLNKKILRLKWRVMII